jgi:hypothetical protein
MDTRSEMECPSSISLATDARMWVVSTILCTNAILKMWISLCISPNFLWKTRKFDSFGRTSRLVGSSLRLGQFQEFPSFSCSTGWLVELSCPKHILNLKTPPVQVNHPYAYTNQSDVPNVPFRGIKVLHIHHLPSSSTHHAPPHISSSSVQALHLLCGGGGPCKG